MPGEEGTNDGRFVTVTVSLGDEPASTGLTSSSLHYHLCWPCSFQCSGSCWCGWGNWDVVQGPGESRSHHQQDHAGKLNIHSPSDGTGSAGAAFPALRLPESFVGEQRGPSSCPNLATLLCGEPQPGHSSLRLIPQEPEVGSTSHSHCQLLCEGSGMLPGLQLADRRAARGTGRDRRGRSQRYQSLSVLC